MFFRTRANLPIAVALAGAILVGCSDSSADVVLVSKDCWVDTMNAQTLPTIEAARGPLVLGGWAADSTAGVSPEKIAVQLLDAKGSPVLVANAKRVNRADVAKAMKLPAYESSGFEVTVDAKALPAGTYGISLAMSRKGAFVVCQSEKKIVLK